jgi:hypothetical protein
VCTCPLDHIDEVGDVDVRQPQGAVAVVFDDAAVDPSPSFSDRWLECPTATVSADQPNTRV